jgi:hypothetical protein
MDAKSCVCAVGSDILYMLVKEGPVKDTIEAAEDFFIEVAEEGSVASVEVYSMEWGSTVSLHTLTRTAGDSWLRRLGNYSDFSPRAEFTAESGYGPRLE